MLFVERCRLEDLLEQGYAPARAADLLGRHPDTIDREMGRGQTVSGYRARVGQDVAEANRRRPKPRHLLDRPALLAEVVARLEARHSPEQIAGRLRDDYPDDPEMWVSHETIYQALTSSRVGSWPGWSRPRYAPDVLNENPGAAGRLITASSKT